MGIPDQLTCLLRNPCMSQEATVKNQILEQLTGSELGKEFVKAVYYHHAYYIMQNAGLDESQAGIKTAGRNINNLRYADDATLMAESEEKLRSLLMRVKEESEKAVLNSTFKKLRSQYPVPAFCGK